MLQLISSVFAIEHCPAGCCVVPPVCMQRCHLGVWLRMRRGYIAGWRLLEGVLHSYANMSS